MVRLILVRFILAECYIYFLEVYPIDCSQFQRDLDVLRSFSYPVQLNPLITAGKTYAVMNSDSQVEELNIYQQNIVSLNIFCLVHLHNLRINGARFALHSDADFTSSVKELSPLISRLDKLRVLSLINTTVSYIDSQTLAALTNIIFL
jgi:hypothetical protein